MIKVTVKLLDQISSRFALWWRYKNGVITFYKMETRVFTIYAFPVTSLQHVQLAVLNREFHVLSTPPAFILSQDQTLMLKS